MNVTNLFAPGNLKAIPNLPKPTERVRKVQHTAMPGIPKGGNRNMNPYVVDVEAEKTPNAYS